MSKSANNEDRENIHSPALIEALLACSAAPTSASTQCLSSLARSNNPRFWDAKIRSEQWFDNDGRPFSILFPAMLEPSGKHSRLDPYFSLPVLKQKPELKDVRTVKAQFELCTLDETYPPDAVVCSKKAANTLMYLVSNCEKSRGSDNQEVIQFLRNAGNSSADPLHFVVHSDPLFPEAADVGRDAVPEFSLEDFENTDLTFTGDVVKQHFSPKKGQISTAAINLKGVGDWTMKDLPDPHGHFRTVMNLYNVDDVPVAVPNVRDASRCLIHPSEYNKRFATPTPVAVEVVMRMWTFAPDTKRQTGTRIYQTCLKSLRLLPLTGASTKAFIAKTITPADPNGKRKADGPAGHSSPTKKGSGQQRAPQEVVD